MKIAVPVFENRISPRFDVAPAMLLFTIEGQKVNEQREICCEEWNDIERVSKLKDLGVDTLICGGLPNYLLDILTNSGIKVIPWVAGSSSEVLNLFLQGRLNSGMVIYSGRRKRYCCKGSRKF